MVIKNISLTEQKTFLNITENKINSLDCRESCALKKIKRDNEKRR